MKVFTLFYNELTQTETFLKSKNLGIHVEPSPGLLPHLPTPPGQRAAGRCAHQTAHLGKHAKFPEVLQWLRLWK